jgi:hypothetical protein
VVTPKNQAKPQIIKNRQERTPRRFFDVRHLCSDMSITLDSSILDTRGGVYSFWSTIQVKIHVTQSIFGANLILDFKLMSQEMSMTP